LLANFVIPERRLSPQPQVTPTYLAFLGRIAPEKGPDHAIRIARVRKAAFEVNVDMGAQVAGTARDAFADQIAGAFFSRQRQGTLALRAADRRSRSYLQLREREMSKRETPMTRRYWERVRGTLLEEYLVIPSRPPDDRCSHHRGPDPRATQPRARARARVMREFETFPIKTAAESSASPPVSTARLRSSRPKQRYRCDGRGW
jgi:hypothetical protein